MAQLLSILCLQAVEIFLTFHCIVPFVRLKWHCQSVRSLVRPLVMKQFFFSLRSNKGVSSKGNGCFKEVSRMFHASFMDRKFQGCFKKVL